ncbi:MAG: hypothetical protein KAJ53_02470 [Anaerolineales bacterium]|nr:hypothetical protein [Anaerolineales bacterium]
MVFVSDVREFKPEQVSRRGEFIAWGCAVLVGVLWLVLIWQGQAVTWAILLLEIFLLFAGTSISLGNWMDRKTLLRLDQKGISYKNGLRKVQMNWQDIRQVRVLPTRWGSKVQVIGEDAYFEFRTLGEVKIGGELKGRMGFEKGDEILQAIVIASDLQKTDDPGDGYYYARE